MSRGYSEGTRNNVLCILELWFRWVFSRVFDGYSKLRYSDYLGGGGAHFGISLVWFWYQWYQYSYSRSIPQRISKSKYSSVVEKVFKSISESTYTFSRKSAAQNTQILSPTYAQLPILFRVPRLLHALYSVSVKTPRIPTNSFEYS